MRIGGFAALALVVATAAGCGRGGFFRQYEYEEEIYLSLDGSATVYVNSSVPALDALRGASFDPAPNAGLDRNQVREFFETPVTHVTRTVATSRRSNRRFVHVRLDVADVGRLNEAAPFAWSTYDFHQDGESYVYHQTVGPSAGKGVPDVGWNGREFVAFRLHLPSRIGSHTGSFKRGNILVWEQPLADRLRGTPLTLDAQMATQSILYRTLWLFAVTFLAVAATFGVVIWWILRRTPQRPPQPI